MSIIYCRLQWQIIAKDNYLSIVLQGFLSAQLSFPQLIAFGLALFAKSTNATRLNLLVKGLPGLVVMLARLSTTIGYNYRIEQDRASWQSKKDTRVKSLTMPPP